jgi:large subunit ribosomal protein L29
MKASELRALALDELVQKSSELQSEYFNVKVKHTTGQLENTAKLKQLRREVARVVTVLQEKREATG